jgi:hypothetical protein
MSELGYRRRAFRLLDGEIEYDLCSRRALEKQERWVIREGRVWWPSSTMGTYNKIKSGYVGKIRLTGTERLKANRLRYKDGV